MATRRIRSIVIQAGSTGQVGDIDHKIPFNHANPKAGGLTVPWNLKCLCLAPPPGNFGLKKLSSQQTSSVALPHLTPRRVAAEFRLLCAPEASASLAAPDAQRPRVDADRLSTRGRHTLPSAQLPGGFGHACSG